MRRTISLFAVLFSLLAADAAAQAGLPPLAAGQRVQFIARIGANPRVEIIADVLQVGEADVTVLVRGVVSFLGRELIGTRLELPRSNIITYSILVEAPQGMTALLYIVLVGMFLALAIPGLLVFLKYKKLSPEGRRRQWRETLPALLMILGIVGGLFVGAAAGQILGMHRYEVTSVGGKRGIPAEVVMTILGAVIFGFFGYSYGRKRQERSRRKSDNSKA
jgi:hypothetical protein